MEWVAFVVSIAVITCGYVVVKFQRIEREMMKKVEQFLIGYADEYTDMRHILTSDLQSTMQRIYQVHKEDFNKIWLQTDRIKDLLQTIRALTDTRDKNEKQIIALKATIERCERKLKKAENKKV